MIQERRVGQEERVMRTNIKIRWMWNVQTMKQIENSKIIAMLCIGASSIPLMRVIKHLRYREESFLNVDCHAGTIVLVTNVS